MDLPSYNENYANKDYWDERYKEEETFDWFVKYEILQDKILSTIGKSDKILNLGCGNSSLSMDMYNDGYHNIVNVDYSDIVIANMKERCKDCPGMDWKVLDARDMTSLEAESFDVVLEKGTLDAMLVTENDPWNISQEAESTINSILHQISRLLKPNGRFISVTFAQPHFRIPLYARLEYGWNIVTDTIGSGFHYFFYVLTKGLELSPADSDLRERYFRRPLEMVPVVFVSDSEDEDYLMNRINLDSD